FRRVPSPPTSPARGGGKAALCWKSSPPAGAAPSWGRARPIRSLSGMPFCSSLLSRDRASSSRVLLGAFELREVSLMRGAVNVVKEQHRNRYRAEYGYDGNEDHAQLMQDRGVDLARRSLLRKAYPSED